ncbi:mitochondrial sodium/calcium exchanger protein isoform X2 [Drosophila simulans]|uniref:mitochondrial sodium/calcium exchanger protein isoform X2 n=1 Tax=Drosophila simulans TaxID=7240 RepID=UPI001D1160C1|nr:mitochondrial sodium/calcium exchanger protein isoform X2 [Drosophila simulans]
MSATDTKTTKSDVFFVPNAMDAEFDNFWKTVSCFAANSFPFEERCEFVKKAVNCNSSTNVIPYMRLLACDLKCINQFQEMIFIALFVAFCFQILVILIYTINVYPALKAVSRFLHMNEHLAGVTLMAFGNTSADLFANLASVERHVPVFANNLSSALFVITISGGLICYISPFKMNSYETVRDILFLLLATLLMDYFASHHFTLSYDELKFLIVLLVYISYIIINVADVYLLQKTIASTRAKMQKLLDEKETPEIALKLQELERKLEYYSQDTRVEILEKSSSISITRIRYTTMRMIRNPRVSVNRRYTRTMMLDYTQSKNQGIFRDFFLALRPIKCQAWKQAELLNRVLLLIRAPAVIICTLYIPLVDYELEKHGWNKLLNAINVVVNPALSISIFLSFMHRKANVLWYISLQNTLMYGAYSFVLTVPFAVFILFHSRTDVPPSYHWVFTIMNLTGSMFLIFLCATEIDTVLEVIGNILSIDDNYMGATVKAFTGNLGTLFANTAVAIHGYPKMAFASAIGGSFFTIVVTGNTVAYVRSLVGNRCDDHIEEYGEIAFIFLNMALFTILLWSTTLGFFARRSMGLYSIGLYVVYLLFVTLVHEEVIHSFSKDVQVKSAFGDI